MDKSKLASELLKLAKSLSAGEPNHEKAFKMLKQAEQVSKKLIQLAKSVESELQQAEKDIKGLEKLGSAHIEAPKLLKQVLNKVDDLNDFTVKMTKEIKIALGEES